MAFTRTSNVIVPAVYTDLVNSELGANVNRFIMSGAMSMDAMIAAELSGDYNNTRGHALNMPMWNPYEVADEEASDLSTDTLATNARVEQDQKMIKLFRVFSFDAANLTRWLAAGDPLGDAVNMAVYNVNKNREAAAVASLAGVVADNIANDSGDLVNSIHAASGSVSSTNRFSRSAVLDTVAQLGDKGALQDIAAMVMHSSVFWQAVKDDSTSFQRASEQETFDRYLGIPVIIDDAVTTETINSNTVYHTYLVKPGGIRIGSSGVMAANWNDESEAAGWGTTRLFTRRVDVIAPNGFSYTSTTNNPANTVLDDAGSWDRILASHKNSPVVVLRSNV